MFTFLTDIGRLFHVVGALIRHGSLIPRQYLPPSMRLAIRLFARTKPNHASSQNSLDEALLSLGPMYIKLGQLLATRPDIIGLDVAQKLSRLKDSVPPFSADQARSSLREEFGDDADTLFGDTGQPVAAASIAQVHRIQTNQGERAVKILRPGIEKKLQIELRALSRAARIIYGTMPSSHRMEPVAFLNTISQATEKELDLTFEAGAMDEFAIGASKDGFFHIPKVDWTRSGRRVLTTEWIDGTRLTRPDAVDQADRAHVARCIAQGFLSSALKRGFFHADMHEGNMILRPPETGQPRLALVDFGLIGRIGTRERRFLAQTLHGFLQRNYMQVAQVHFDAGYVPVGRSVADFAQALRAIGEAVFYRNSQQVQMGRLIMQIFEVTRQFGMHLRPELVLLHKTMIQVEGVARSIDPEHNIWEAAAPVVNSWVAREFGAEGIMRTASRSAGETLRAVAALPVLVESLQKRLDDDARNRTAPASQSTASWRLAAIVSITALLTVAAMIIYPSLGQLIASPLAFLATR